MCNKLLLEIAEKEEKAKLAGGKEKQEKQKAKGKPLCREREETLLDPGSFAELNMLAETQTFEFEMQKKKILGDGVMIGFGTIGGRRVLVFPRM